MKFTLFMEDKDNGDTRTVMLTRDNIEYDEDLLYMFADFMRAVGFSAESCGSRNINGNVKWSDF